MAMPSSTWIGLRAEKSRWLAARGRDKRDPHSGRTTEIMCSTASRVAGFPQLLEVSASNLPGLATELAGEAGQQWSRPSGVDSPSLGRPSPLTLGAAQATTAVQPG